MRALAWILVGVSCVGTLARADAPLVYCVGTTSGGYGPRAYAYEVHSDNNPMVEFRVGTNDLNPAHYTNVLLPPDWNFAVEPAPMRHSAGWPTPYGEVSPGPSEGLAAGIVHFWAADPELAVELFTFGFEHPWTPEDVGWELLTRSQGLFPEYAEFQECWDEAMGLGLGPLQGPSRQGAHLNLGPEELVQDDGGADIAVPGYSVPTFVHWDGDGLKDLVIGEGSGTLPAKVRVYLNSGTVSDPQFSDYFYAQSDGFDLVVPGEGCQGAFPRVVYWDADGRKDLLVGQADGTARLFRNTATEEDPSFDGGTLLQVGEPGFKTDIDVDRRATCTVVDWNNDAKKDLVLGALDGKIRVFLNEGTDTEPDFRSELLAQANGADLVVPTLRSSPVIRDLDNDGRKDLLTGNTEGQLLLYSNTGSDEAPSFSDYSLVEANGVPINLPDTPRSRPFVCDWTGDGLLDVLIGASDGRVHLYQTVPMPGDIDNDGDVDLVDFATFAMCFMGANVTTPPPGCSQDEFAACDLTGDHDVDLNDFADFAEDFTG